MAEGPGLAAGEVEEDVADFALLVGILKSGDEVGLVLAVGDPRRFRIRGLVGDCVDRRAGDAGLACERIRVNADEQRRAGGAGDLHPLPEWNKDIRAAGHQHPIAAGLVEMRGKRPGEIEDDVLFQCSVRTAGAGIDATMAGIEHDQRQASGGLFGRGRNGSRRRLRCPDRLADRGQEGRAVAALQFDHETISAALNFACHLHDPCRLGQIDDDARFPGSEEPKAK